MEIIARDGLKVYLVGVLIALSFTVHDTAVLGWFAPVQFSYEKLMLYMTGVWLIIGGILSVLGLISSFAGNRLFKASLRFLLLVVLETVLVTGAACLLLVDPTYNFQFKTGSCIAGIALLAVGFGLWPTLKWRWWTK